VDKDKDKRENENEDNVSNTEENGKSLEVEDAEIEIEIADRKFEEHGELEVSHFPDRDDMNHDPDCADRFAAVVSCLDCDPPSLVLEHDKGCSAGDEVEACDEDTSFLRLLDTPTQLEDRCSSTCDDAQPPTLPRNKNANDMMSVPQSVVQRYCPLPSIVALMAQRGHHWKAKCSAS